MLRMFRPGLIASMIRFGSKVDAALRDDSPGGRKLTPEEAVGLLDEGVDILRRELLRVAGPKAAELLKDAA